MENSFSMDGSGGWFGDDSSTLHLLYTLFLLLLHEIHLRASGIRSQRLGNPALRHFIPEVLKYIVRVPNRETLDWHKTSFTLYL